MKDQILFSLWFFLPVGIANVTPIFAAKMPVLKNYNFPLDFYKTIGGKRIFGDHKTIRGLIVGIMCAVIIVFLQQYVYNQSSFIQSSISFDYYNIKPITFGMLCALGALLGDAMKSFFKRRVGIAEGKTWFPFDQIDYILGGILLTSLYIRLSIDQYVLIFIVWFLIHILSTTTGYLLKLKERPL